MAKVSGQVLVKRKPHTEGSRAWGEHSIPYRFVESLCCVPETNVTLCVNYTSIKNTQKHTPVFRQVLGGLSFLFQSRWPPNTALIFLWQVPLLPSEKFSFYSFSSATTHEFWGYAGGLYPRAHCLLAGLHHLLSLILKAWP